MQSPNLSSEIADMINHMNTPASTEPPTTPPVEPIVVEEPTPEPPVATPVTTLSVVTPPIEPTVEPVVPPVVETPPAVETVPEGGQEALDEMIAYRTELNDLARKLLGANEQPTTETPAVTPPTPPKQETPPPPVVTTTPSGMQPFSVTSEEFDSALDNVDGFNKVVSLKINNYVQSAVNAIVESRITEIMRTMPTMNANMVRTMVGLEFATHRFYSSNEDLVAFKPFIAMIGNEVMSKNPTYTIDKVYEEVEKEARKKLRLPKAGQPAAPRSTPAFVQPGGSRKPIAPVLEGERKEIADFISSRR